VDADRLFRESPEELAAVGDFAARIGEGLAHFEGHEQCRVPPALLQEVEGLAEDLGTHARGCRCLGVLGIDGGVRRADAVGDGCVRDGPDHRAGGWIMNVESGSSVGVSQSPPMNSRFGTASSSARSPGSVT
jgi:hypothetical protein